MRKDKSEVIIIHCAKYKRGALGHMLAHYRHEHDRENIDRELTKDNYNLAPKHSNDYRFIIERVEETKSKFARKDINMMCDWVVTLPKDYKGNEREFFETAYRFMRDRYGEENVVSAWVHKDEPNAQAHMHFAFVPIVLEIDKNGDRIERLSAKDCINRNELQRIHTVMESWMEKRLGREVNLLNKETKEKARDIKDYKSERISEDLKDVRALREIGKQETVKPRKNLLGGIDKKELEKLLDYEKAKQLKAEREKQDALRSLREEAMKERQNAVLWEKAMREEYKLRLEYQEKWDDIEQVRKQLRELQHIDKKREKDKEMLIGHTER